jgi:hypothetical protein
VHARSERSARDDVARRLGLATSARIGRATSARIADDRRSTHARLTCRIRGASQGLLHLADVLGARLVLHTADCDRAGEQT